MHVLNPISKIMTQHLYTLNLSDTLQKAQSMMSQFNIRHLPVLDGGKLVGIISLTDLNRLSFATDLGDSEGDVDSAVFDMLSIRQVMKSDPHVVQSNETVLDVAKQLTAEEFHALPVVENEKLVGIVTTTDVIKYLIKDEDTKPAIPNDEKDMKGMYL